MSVLAFAFFSTRTTILVPSPEHTCTIMALDSTLNPNAKIFVPNGVRSEGSLLSTRQGGVSLDTKQGGEQPSLDFGPRRSDSVLKRSYRRALRRLRTTGTTSYRGQHWHQNYEVLPDPPSSRSRPIVYAHCLSTNTEEALANIQLECRRVVQ